MKLNYSCLGELSLNKSNNSTEMFTFSFKSQSKFFVFIIIFFNCFLIVSQKLRVKKCYDSLGCIEFTPEWTHALYRPINLLPSDRHAINTIFILWKKHDFKLNPEIIGTNSLNGTEINPNIKLLIHDFTSNGYSGWIKNLANIVLSSPNSGQSVMSVNWAAGAEPPYIQAIANARVVALEIVHFFHKLMITFKIKMENVHIVGHGIGAHIAGYVGKVIRPKRITALDPSGTFFVRMPPNVHLHKNDAEYIEVLHTDDYPSGQGNSELLGHADFFANGGHQQPACDDDYKFLKNIKRGDVKLGETLRGCSHKRSLKYYIESIISKSCTFLGIACESYKNFLAGRCTSCGKDMEHCVRLNTDKPPRSLKSMLGYYFVTSSSPPFCGEMILVKMFLHRTAPEQIFVNGYFNVTIRQAIGNVNFLVNENSLLAALRTSKEHTFLVFRSTPPPLLWPIKSIFFKWHHSPLPCYWCTPPRISEFMLHKLTDISTNKPQWFCTLNYSTTNLVFGGQLEPCRENTNN